MICAGIVTYNPDLERLAENIEALSTQVKDILVVDNGSTDFVGILQTVRRVGDYRVHRNAHNLGMAAALNQLAQQAINAGEVWLLTMDQDSVAQPGMVSLLERACNAETGIVTPKVRDINKEELDRRNEGQAPAVEHFTQAARRGAITSGSLINLKVWALVGGFDESLFIDYVDYDYNQRVLLEGHTIVRVNDAILSHEVGRARRTWLRVPRRSISGRWSVERFYSFGHGAFRCYYKARNRVVFTKKYYRLIGITHEGVFQLPQQILLTLLFETDKLAKGMAFIRGVLDGLREPILPYQPLTRRNVENRSWLSSKLGRRG